MPSTIRRLDDPLFHVGVARSSGLIPRDHGHHVWWEDAGHPEGMPVVLCHGGPGGASGPQRRRFYDPQLWRVIQFDQRGCGRSTPAGHLEGMSLEATIGDMEAIRAHLGVERWVVAGGSWGSTVALAYAQAHPQRVLGLNLACTWLCRRQDIDWWFQGVRSMFPDLWEGFARLVPEDERDDLKAAYVHRILGADQARAEEAAHHLFLYEQGFMHFDAPFAEPEVARGVAYGRIFAHYAAHDFFIQDTQLIDNAYKISNIPTEMVTGRYDCCCPPVNAWDLATALPRANLVIVPAAGHISSEPAMARAVVQAPERLRARILADQAS